MELHAKAFHIAKDLHGFKALHARLFDEIMTLRRERDPSKHVAPLAKVFAEYGLDEAAFKQRLDAPAAAAEVKSGVKLMHASEVRGTPSLTVNGKQYPFYDLFEKVCERTGVHVPEGYAYSRGIALNGPMPNHRIHDAVLAYFGIAAPAAEEATEQRISD